MPAKSKAQFRLMKAAEYSPKVSKKVGVNADGSGMLAYLMRIDEQYYLEDMETLHQEVDEKEDQLRVSLGKTVNDKGQYGNISIGKDL